MTRDQEPSREDLNDSTSRGDDRVLTKLSNLLQGQLNAKERTPQIRDGKLDPDRCTLFPFNFWNWLKKCTPSFPMSDVSPIGTTLCPEDIPASRMASKPTTSARTAAEPALPKRLAPRSVLIQTW